MKKLFIIILLYLMQTSALAETSVSGSHHKQIGNTLYLANDIDNIVLPSFGEGTDFSTAPNWQTVVGQVTGIWGVHLHDYGVNTCRIEQRTSNTTRLYDCTIHNKGTEYDISTSTFSDYTSFNLPYSSTFFSISSNTVILSDTYITDEQLKTRIPVGRVQQTTTGGLSIIDLRYIASEDNRLNHLYNRTMVGPAVSTGGGLIITGSGTRNLDISEGKFSDEERQVHQISGFNQISGLYLWRTGIEPFQRFTTVGGARDILQIDNVYYNDLITGTLSEAQNNNKYLISDLYMSAAGGIVDGDDTGRKPTFLLFYGTNEYDSLEDARNATSDIGIFIESNPKLLPISRLILRKNQAAIEDFFSIRPFITRAGGAPSAIQSTISLQGAYNNSMNGGTAEIKTNDQNEDLTIQYEGTNAKIFDAQDLNTSPVFTIYTSKIDIAFHNMTTARFDDYTTSGGTRFLIYDVDNDKLERVSVGISDSGGSGFKVLRIPN